MRTAITTIGGRRSDTATPAADASALAGLLAELASAGLVSVAEGDDGGLEYALTPQGERAARSMAMSRQDHALVLLGAALSLRDRPN